MFPVCDDKKLKSVVVVAESIDDDFNVENPLLQICKCRGGVEFIHF
jgi:hypothetical protein